MVAWITFYKVANLKSLAIYWLKLYHTHKIWCEDTDKGLIECGKVQEWFTNYSTSELVMVYKGRHLRDTMWEGSRLNYNYFIYFYITDKLYFYILISF